MPSGAGRAVKIGDARQALAGSPLAGVLTGLPEGICLHVGGTTPRKGWTILNAVPGEHVDVLGDCRDLSTFASAGCSLIYASHVLEHLGYDRDLPHVLAEFRRLLAPGGVLLISVPDLDVLCRWFASPELSAQDRFFVMRMMFGGRTDAYDVHLSGLNLEILADFLGGAGFSRLQRVTTFGLFEDTSVMAFKGQSISLNLVVWRD